MPLLPPNVVGPTVSAEGLLEIPTEPAVSREALLEIVGENRRNMRQIRIELDKLVTDLLSIKVVKQKFSADSLYANLEKLLNEIAQLTSSAPETVTPLVAELLNWVETYSSRTTVYIPLVGVEMQGIKTVKLGPVTLVTMDEGEIARARSELAAPTVDTDLAALQELSGFVCAKMSVVADMTNAKLLAQAECDRIIDLLRYFIPWIYPRSLRVMTGVQGNISHGARSRVILMVSSTGFVGGSWQATGPLDTLRLTPKTLGQMIDVGVFSLAGLWEKPTRTPFEETLLDAVHWYANAQTELALEYEFLSLIICLETLFTRGPQEPVTVAVAEGVAFVLGSNRDTRMEFRDKMRSLYDTRSKIAHGGGASISKEDVEDLRDITAYVLLQLIRRREEFHDRQKLFAWLEEQKFGHAPSALLAQMPATEEEKKAIYLAYVDVGLSALEIVPTALVQMPAEVVAAQDRVAAQDNVLP